MTYSRTTRGYTLLELIVSIGIFSIVMLAVTGAYLALINLERKARAVSDLNANLSFAIDSMARTIRTGKDYSCPSGGNGTCSELSFTDSQNKTMTYLLRSDGTIGQCTSGICTASNAVSLTDPRIRIDTLTFYVRGVGTGDDAQPQVTFRIRGNIATGEGKQTNFALQGGATQRLIEI